MKDKNYKEVLDDIKSEFTNLLNTFSSELNSRLTLIEEESSNIDKKIQETINSFIQRKVILRLNPLENLKGEISKNIGDPKKDLSEELMNELKNSCEGLNNLWNKKGFKDWICSLFSSEKHLTTVIDMMVETLSNKFIYISDLLSEKCQLYKSKILCWLRNLQNSSLTEFSKTEATKWKELCLNYEKNRDNIKSAGFK